MQRQVTVSPGVKAKICLVGMDGAVAGVLLLSEYPRVQPVSPEQRAFDEEEGHFIGLEGRCWHGITCLSVALSCLSSLLTRLACLRGAHSGRSLVLTLDLTKDYLLLQPRINC